MKNISGRNSLLVMLGAAPMVLAGAIASPPADWDESFPAGTSFVKKGFNRVSHRKGVTVWHDTGADSLRLGAEGRIGAPAAAILKALIDYDNQPGVIARLTEGRVLERGDHWLLAYERISLPMISDRDYSVFMTWGEEHGTTLIRYWAVSGRGPGPRDGVVRVTNHRGSWLLQPIEGGSATKVRYQISIDFAGWIPKWLVKVGPGSEITELYENVCAMVEKQAPGTITGACPF